MNKQQGERHLARHREDQRHYREKLKNKANESNMSE